MESSAQTWRRTFALVLAHTFAVLTFAAKADAPTHRLAVSTRSIQTNCSNGECTSACSITGTLTNVGHRTSVPLQVNIWFADTSTDAGESAIALGFPALQVNQSSMSTDEGMHYSCDKLIVRRVEVVCSESGADEKCPGFYNVAVPDVSSPKITRQDVEGK